MRNQGKQITAPSPTTLPDEEKSWRFLSDFDDKIIRIDVSESIKLRGSKVREFDTRAFLVNATGGVGIHTGIHRLEDFPHLLPPMLNAANSALKGNEGGPAQAFTDTIRLSTLIYCWMFRRGFTWLAELGREDVQQLSAEVSERGWWDLMQYQQALLQEATNILQNPDRLFEIATQRTDVIWAFSPEALSFKIGLPINGNDIPRWFRTATVTKKIPAFKTFDRPTRAGPTRREHLMTMTTINRLALLGDGFDSIRFHPFPKAAGELAAGDKRRAHTLEKRLAVSSDDHTEATGDQVQSVSGPQVATPMRLGDAPTASLDALAQEIDTWAKEGAQQAAKAPSQHATPNMPLHIAVAGFKEALRWQYDYKDAILEVLRLLRDSLESKITEQRVVAKPFTVKVIEKANSILASAGVPLRVNKASKFGDDPDGDNSASSLVNTTLFALYFNIATNLGRRPGEIHGAGKTKKSYGLHRGCCVRVSDKLPFHRIETYIQKSIGAYATSWCNQLVADAVSFLEEMFQIARPLFTSSVSAKTDVEIARTEKLFQFPRFTERGFNSEPPIFDARQASTIFFQLAGIDPAIFLGRQMPFRRTFMTLYVHRFDSPELLALQQYMKDFSIESLLAYYRDKANCLPEDSIKAHYAEYETEALNIASMLREERKLYLIEILTDLLAGQRRFGGGFARVVNALLKRLSLPENFKDAAVSKKAESIADELEQRGYRLVEGNTICMAGDAGKTKEQSNCFDGERPRIELACPSMCSGCVHAISTEVGLSIFEEEMESALKTANDKRLPAALRKQAQALIETLKEVIASEKAMAEGTRIRFQRFADSWTTIREELPK
ncbi:hypothetical protein [Paraburkholderia fungorum]|uniref:hypothetical protein n=1 Tax=Paraburkholderia fungorum TaxID=134537 RepID=UPI003877BE62